MAAAAWQRGEDIAAALDEAFGHDLVAVDDAHRTKLETLSGVHSNAAGFRRWLETRDASGAAPPAADGRSTATTAATKRRD